MTPNLRVLWIVSALLILVPLVLPGWVVFILTKALFMSIAVLGVVLFLRGGQITFGHALFFATGTYTVGFSVKWFDFRETLVLVPMGALMGLIMAALVGAIVARYRGLFFAMLNMAFSMIVYAILLKFYWVTGGTDGISVGTATFLGLPLPAGTYRFYYFTLVIAGCIAYVLHRFMASPLGYFLRAVADNEIRIEYSGESVRRVIYFTYILAGGLGGVSGALAAFTIGHVVPEDAFWIQSAQFVFIALLGGFEGGVIGSLMGSVAFDFIQTYSSKYFPYAWQLTLGVIMLFVILFRPGGLWAIYESLVSRFSSKAEGSTHG
jgi:ABC-type branched-subunit amino acid transport system permease subunit